MITTRNHWVALSGLLYPMLTLLMEPPEEVFRGVFMERNIQSFWQVAFILGSANGLSGRSWRVSGFS